MEFDIYFVILDDDSTSESQILSMYSYRYGCKLICIIFFCFTTLFWIYEAQVRNILMFKILPTAELSSA